MAQVKERLKDLDSKMDKLQQEKTMLLKIIKKGQDDIQHRLATQWPAIRTPYTAAFRMLMLDHADDVQQVILSQDGYPDLVSSEDTLRVLENDMLHLRRETVQMKKILWMRKLARIYAQFQQYANEQQMADYNQLMQCEDAPL